MLLHAGEICSPHAVVINSLIVIMIINIEKLHHKLENKNDVATDA